MGTKETAEVRDVSQIRFKVEDLLESTAELRDAINASAFRLRGETVERFDATHAKMMDVRGDFHSIDVMLDIIRLTILDARDYISSI